MSKTKTKDALTLSKYPRTEPTFMFNLAVWRAMPIEEKLALLNRWIAIVRKEHHFKQIQLQINYYNCSYLTKEYRGNAAIAELRILGKDLASDAKAERDKIRTFLEGEHERFPKIQQAEPEDVELKIVAF